MHLPTASRILALGLASLSAAVALPQSPSPPASAPPAPVRPVVDDYFGTKVTDPYRYMENLKDPEVQAWLKSQNDYTRTVLGAIPGRADLLARLRQLDQAAPRVFALPLPDDTYLVFKQLPGDDTDKLYIRKGIKGSDRLVVDPEKIKLAPEDQAKGKNGIGDAAVSDDGSLIVVTITPGGAEVNSELHVIETATGRELPDAVKHGACAEGLCVSWLPGNRAFVYGRLQDLPPGASASQVRQNFRAYLHVIGTDAEQDKPVFGSGVVTGIDVDPSLIASVVVPKGSRYAIGVLNGSVTPNSAYYIAPVDELGKPGIQWRKINDFDYGITDVAVAGDNLYLLTYHDAPRYKVVLTDARNPDLASAQVVVPPGEAVVTGLHRAKDALYVELMDGGIGRLLRLSYGPHPKPEKVPLPFDGAIYPRSNHSVDGLLIYATTWTSSMKAYAYDPTAKRVFDTGVQPSGPFDDPGNLGDDPVSVLADVAKEWWRYPFWLA